MAEHVRAEWGLDHAFKRLPIYAQTGEERHANVDKMILKRVDSLPHGLINTPELAREHRRLRALGARPRAAPAGR